VEAEPLSPEIALWQARADGRADFLFSGAFREKQYSRLEKAGFLFLHIWRFKGDSAASPQ
jgi:hypothetical protein